MESILHILMVADRCRFGRLLLVLDDNNTHLAHTCQRVVRVCRGLQLDQRLIMLVFQSVNRFNCHVYGYGEKCLSSTVVSNW
jgi:hypothetical protein